MINDQRDLQRLLPRPTRRGAARQNQTIEDLVERIREIKGWEGLSSALLAIRLRTTPVSAGRAKRQLKALVLLEE